MSSREQDVSPGKRSERQAVVNKESDNHVGQLNNKSECRIYKNQGKTKILESIGRSIVGIGPCTTGVEAYLGLDSFWREVKI